MTLSVAQAMEKVTHELDARLQQRWDTLFLRLIVDGVDPEGSWIYSEQIAIDRQWRETALAEIRQQLVDALGSSWLTH
jgi:elongation factor P--beta-lysine ligase